MPGLPSRAPPPQGPLAVHVIVSAPARTSPSAGVFTGDKVFINHPSKYTAPYTTLHHLQLNAGEEFRSSEGLLRASTTGATGQAGTQSTQADGNSQKSPKNENSAGGRWMFSHKIHGPVQFEPCRWEEQKTYLLEKASAAQVRGRHLREPDEMPAAHLHTEEQPPLQKNAYGLSWL